VDDGRATERRTVKGITPSNYVKDHYYPKVKKAVAELLEERGVVAPVDLFVKLGFLSEVGLQDWRSGRVKCLETCSDATPRRPRVFWRS
jgi:hypothetical protein